MADWEACQQKTPEFNRQMVWEKVRSGFHVGVLAYDGSTAVAWISVGPIIENYWTWKRVAALGERAADVAGITCLNIADGHRGAGVQGKVIAALKDYGKQTNWKTIEAYPFDTSAVARHGDGVLWPGTTRAFEQAGFVRLGAHWLCQAEFERSIFGVDII